LTSKKIYFIFGLVFAGGNVISGGIFVFFWPLLPDPGPQPIDPFFWLKFFSETKQKVFRALEWLSSISVANIMDKKTKIGKNFASTNPNLGWNTPFLYMDNTCLRIELESCSNPL